MMSKERKLQYMLLITLVVSTVAVCVMAFIANTYCMRSNATLAQVPIAPDAEYVEEVNENNESEYLGSLGSYQFYRLTSSEDVD